MADVAPLPTPDELFAANTKLAYRVANRYTRWYPHLKAEFENAALTALWLAGRDHDPARGEFGHHAGFKVGVAMRRLLREERGRRPHHQSHLVPGGDGELVDALDLVADGRATWSAAEVEDLLAALTPDQRSLVELNVFDGCGHAALGELLGVSDVTARKRVRKGLERLRAAMGA